MLISSISQLFLSQYRPSLSPLSLANSHQTNIYSHPHGVMGHSNPNSRMGLSFKHLGKLPLRHKRDTLRLNLIFMPSLTPMLNLTLMLNLIPMPSLALKLNLIILMLILKIPKLKRGIFKPNPKPKMGPSWSTLAVFSLLRGLPKLILSQSRAMLRLISNEFPMSLLMRNKTRGRPMPSKGPGPLQCQPQPIHM